MTEQASSINSCINCGHEVTEAFCPSCGQRTNIKRISFIEGWSDFWSRLYGFDGMLPRTLRDLTIRPGAVAQSFINGIRVKYYGPVGYFFLMATLLLLLLSSIGLSFGELVADTRKNFPFQSEENNLSRWALGFVTNNIKLVLFLGIPFQGIAARLFFFRKSGYRLTEHMVLPFYLTGHLLWVTMLFAVLKILFGTSIPSSAGIISLLFYGFGYLTWMTQQAKVKSFFKGLGIYVVGQLLFMLFITIIAILAIVWFAYFDRETFELLRPNNN